jgi:phosphate transport system substrate-binding protein
VKKILFLLAAGCLVFLFGCLSNARTIKIKGSDTEVNLAVQLAESYRLVNTHLFVSISGGGSGLGIASLLNGTADIANSSRAVSDQELQLFKQQKIQLQHLVFAQDAIAFVVSNDNPLDSISDTDLAKLLEGTVKHWSSIAGINKSVTIYGRQSNSGTYSFIKKKLSIEFSPYAKQMNGNAQILEAIRQDNSGIGYVGAGYVMNGGAKGLKVLQVYTKTKAAVSPLDAKAIRENRYIFQRPLYQYYRAGSYEKIKNFLDFEQSAAGKKIIADAGYYPILQTP